MPTIRVTTPYGQCLYEADRVLRDSQALVVEARRDHVWVRVGFFTAADVTAVDRLVPGEQRRWLTEDVRYAVGVAPTSPQSTLARRTVSRWWRRRAPASR